MLELATIRGDAKTVSDMPRTMLSDLEEVKADDSKRQQHITEFEKKIYRQKTEVAKLEQEVAVLSAPAAAAAGEGCRDGCFPPCSVNVLYL